MTDFTVTVSAADLAAIAHDVLDPAAWIQHSIEQGVDKKAKTCRRRMVAENAALLGDTVPRDDGQAQTLIVKHSSYKNRAARQAAEDAKLAAEAAAAAAAQAEAQAQADADAVTAGDAEAARILAAQSEADKRATEEIARQVAAALEAAGITLPA
jgi:hypothetical protein